MSIGSSGHLISSRDIGRLGFPEEQSHLRVTFKSSKTRTPVHPILCGVRRISNSLTIAVTGTGLTCPSCSKNIKFPVTDQLTFNQGTVPIFMGNFRLLHNFVSLNRSVNIGSNLQIQDKKERIRSLPQFFPEAPTRKSSYFKKKDDWFPRE